MQQLGLIADASELDTVSADDSGGVFSVPALAGLGAPWWAPEARASFTGMSLSTERGHLVLAVLQGIAAQVAELGDLVAQDSGRPLTKLRVDGGLTQSAVLMQSVADLMQIPIEVYPSQHATPLGAAALARIALEPSLRLDEAVIAWQPTVIYEPRWAGDRASEFRASWRSLIH